MHDVIEDCGVSMDLLEDQFGSLVSDYIWELTNKSYLQKGLTRKERKKIDFGHLRLISREAQCIKMIDRIDNLSDTQNVPIDWLVQYLQESKVLLDTIGWADAEIASELRQTINNAM